MNQTNFNSFTVLNIVYKKRKSVLIISTIMAIASAILTMPCFILPTYKSEAILYPPSSNSNKNIIEGGSSFGSDKEIDEQIQILKSAEVRDSIIKKYKLIKHYKIDTTVKTWSDLLYKRFDANVNIDRTQYNSISVIVFDTDPELAADMANDVVKFGDEIKNKIIKKNLIKIFESLSYEQTLKVKEVDTIADRLNALKKQNLFSVIPYKLKTDLEKFKDQMAVRELMYNAKAEGDYSLLELLFGYENKLNELKDLQENYSRAYIDFISPVPESYVVSSAQPSFKKVAPMRTVIVMITFFGSVIILSAWILFYEKILPGFKQM